MKKIILYLFLLNLFQFCSTDTNNDLQTPVESNRVIIDSVKLPAKIEHDKDEGSKPIDDLTHIEAIVIAKDFVAKKLNISPPPVFKSTNVEWRKIKHNYYKIFSEVEAFDADCILQRWQWEVKLKYTSGEWGDANNWKLIDLKMQKK